MVARMAGCSRRKASTPTELGIGAGHRRLVLTSIENMFDERVARAVGSRAVVVNSARVWPQLVPGVILPGTLRTWFRTQCGDWLGALDLAVQVRGVDLLLSMLVPETALRSTAERCGQLSFSSAEAVRPPQLVLVHPGRLWPPRRFRWAVETSLFVKAAGVQLNQLEVGVLRGWVRAGDRPRLGYVDWVVPMQGVGVQLAALIPEVAVRPTTAEEIADLDALRTASLWR